LPPVSLGPYKAFNGVFDPAHIKIYARTWDEIVNHGRFDMLSDSNFATDLVMHIHPDVAGVDRERASIISSIGPLIIKMAV
jgi:hypothetical protein